MYSKQVLMRLWSNDQKRRAFVNDYKSWGVWLRQPELDLTYYKYDLPDKSRIIALEHLRSPYASEWRDVNGQAVVCALFYLQTGDYFRPSAVSDYTVAGHLKTLKAKLAAEPAESEAR